MKLRLGKDGSIRLPAGVTEALGVSAGDEVLIETCDGGFRLSKCAVPLQPSRTPSISPLPEHPADAEGLEEAIARKNLQTPVQVIKGVGPKLSEMLAKRGIRNVEDALYLLPHRYEDRRDVQAVVLLRPGLTEVFSGRVLSADMTATKGGRRFFEVVVADQTGSVTLKWFNSNPTFMKRVWRVDRVGVFTGEVTQFGYQREVHHPDVEWIDDGRSIADVLAADPVNFGRIVPVYPLTEGLSQKVMRRLMKDVVDGFLPNVRELIPAEILQPMQLPGICESLRYVHQPPPESVLDDLNVGGTPAHRALAFDEFFFWELGLALKRRGVTLEEGIAFQVTHRYTKQLARLLPFELTAAQRRVLSEIKSDMMAPHPMHRLVQGDVGCGKTLVALMAALVAVENGYQVAIMAPTEILAEQHWLVIHRWCAELGNVSVLINAGRKGRAKADVRAQVAAGTAQIVIGTHAVIQDKVEFARLGLGIIDEQHRFGVVQRGVLRKKGSNPDILVMTATPIPRTLAMTLFGDLSLSVIDELPPGRSPVETKVFFESRRSQVYGIISEEVSKGHQVYIIYPLVEETEKSDLKAASQMAEHLDRDVFPELRTGLLHGRMSPEEKEGVMASFKARELDILVATTVV